MAARKDPIRRCSSIEETNAPAPVVMDHQLLLGLLSFLMCGVMVSHAAIPARLFWDLRLPDSPMPPALNGLSLSLSSSRALHVLTTFHADATIERTPATFTTTTDPIGLCSTSPDEHNLDSSITMFFTERDLHPEAKMTLFFPKNTSSPTFLDRQASNLIPFSSADLPEILSRFSIDPTSTPADAIKRTLQLCEEKPAAEGDVRHCATSLESMVEFSTSVLGTRDVRAVSAAVGKQGPGKQQYTIKPWGVRRIGGGRSSFVICRAMNYPYAVYYCHSHVNRPHSRRAYAVSLAREDGAAVEGVALCHTNTEGWSPNHLAFRVLKAKPGDVVCHFLNDNDVLWISRSGHGAV